MKIAAAEELDSGSGTAEESAALGELQSGSFAAVEAAHRMVMVAGLGSQSVAVASAAGNQSAGSASESPYTAAAME